MIHRVTDGTPSSRNLACKTAASAHKPVQPEMILIRCCLSSLYDRVEGTCLLSKSTHHKEGGDSTWSSLSLSLDCRKHSALYVSWLRLSFSWHKSFSRLSASSLPAALIPQNVPQALSYPDPALLDLLNPRAFVCVCVCVASWSAFLFLFSPTDLSTIYHYFVSLFSCYYSIKCFFDSLFMSRYNIWHYFYLHLFHKNNYVNCPQWFPGSPFTHIVLIMLILCLAHHIWKSTLTL